MPPHSVAGDVIVISLPEEEYVGKSDGTAIDDEIDEEDDNEDDEDEDDEDDDDQNKKDK